MNLFRKVKLSCTCFNTTSTPHPTLKQGESETTLSPDLPSTRIIRSTIPFVQPNVRFRDPLRAASNNEVHMPSFSPIRTQTL